MGNILAAHYGRRDYKNSCTDNDTAERMMITPCGRMSIEGSSHGGLSKPYIVKLV